MFGNSQAVAHWNAFYRELTTRNGLARRVALEGMSRGGLYIYNWAAANPEKVACIYADAPVCDIHSWAKRKGKSPTAARFFADWLKSYGLAAAPNIRRITAAIDRGMGHLKGEDIGYFEVHCRLNIACGARTIGLTGLLRLGTQ